MNWAGKSSHHTETKISSANISGGGNVPTAPQGGKTVGGGEFRSSSLTPRSFSADSSPPFFSSVSHVESIGKQV